MSTGIVRLDLLLEDIVNDSISGSEESVYRLMEQYPGLNEKQAKEICLMIADSNERKKEEAELVVTAPPSFTIPAKTTKVVVDEMIRSAKSNITMTGYSLSTYFDEIHDDNCYCKYYDVVYILFHTGIRISEFCGLTIRDVDLKNRILNIDHQLQRTSDMKYVIEKTKTNAGTRKLPMNDDVTECFRRILKAREAPEVEKIIDGHSGFLFLDENGMPEVAMHWEHRFNHMVHRYNDIFREQMPNITPHVCRHTYCSLQAKAGMYPKTLQYLMGHSDISVTMNTYTHLGLEDAVEEMSRMQDVENATTRKEQEKLNGKTDEVKISKNQFRAG